MAGNEEISLHDSRQNAQMANQKLQNSVNRWMWTRCGLALLMLVTGFAVWYFPLRGNDYVSLFAFPLWAGAIIFLLMAVDARQRSLEVAGRHWLSSTPRFKNHSSASTESEHPVEEQE